VLLAKSRRLRGEYLRRPDPDLAIAVFRPARFARFLPPLSPVVFLDSDQLHSMTFAGNPMTVKAPDASNARSIQNADRWKKLKAHDSSCGLIGSELSRYVKTQLKQIKRGTIRGPCNETNGPDRLPESWASNAAIDGDFRVLFSHSAPRLSFFSLHLDVP
jgi:hypothetical protein